MEGDRDEFQSILSFSPGVLKLWPVFQIHQGFFVNKVLLEHILFHIVYGEWQKPHGRQKPNTFTIWPFAEKFSTPALEGRALVLIIDVLLKGFALLVKEAKVALR